MKNTKKNIITMITAVVIVISSTITASALTMPDSFYDGISWTWYYSDVATTDYNCLGFATGSMVWEWPWGADNPTDSQVTSYLSGKGYKTSGKWPQILSYGSSSSNIVHFSKVTGEVWCRAKWGSLEKFNHGSYDPYYHNSVYGSLVRKYYS